jgi:uncharacterized protein YecE (DUF72 family)
VVEDFQFSVKLSKSITHVKELIYDAGCMDLFMEPAAGIGNKKGCVLIQFPGKITLDLYQQVENILTDLQMRDPDKKWKKAIEFRHPSWYTGETYELLDEFRASLVLNDIPKAKMLELKGHPNFVYIRFHGPTGNYRGSYSDDFLKEMATEINNWARSGKDVYIYFNNTIGQAFDNAISLKKYLGV